MAILVLEHHPLEPSAALGKALRDHGHRQRVIALHDGQTLPADLDEVEGLVIMGGPMNVDEQEAYPWMAREMQIIEEAHARHLPMVGICLGAQLIAKALGGEVQAMPRAEIAWGEIVQAFPGTIDTLHAGTPWRSVQFIFHGQQITRAPAGAAVLAKSSQCPIHAFSLGMHVYGFQYHFELEETHLRAMLGDGDYCQWITASGGDPRQLLAAMPGVYPMYRQLGDRLCKRIADLLFPIDKRLSHKAGVLNSYDPAIS